MRVGLRDKAANPTYGWTAFGKVLPVIKKIPMGALPPYPPKE